MHAGQNNLEGKLPLHHSSKSNNTGLRCGLTSQARWAKRQAQASGLATAAKQVTFRQGAAADVKGIQKMVLAER